MRSDKIKIKTREDVEAWKKWFAWYPVQVPVMTPEGYFKWVWLEFIERRTQYLRIPDFGPLPTEYRFLAKEP